MNEIERKHAIADRFLFLLEDFKSIDKMVALHFRNSHIEELGKMLAPLHERLQEIKTQCPTLGKEIDSITESRATRVRDPKKKR